MIVSLADMKAQLNFTDDLGTGDDALITAKIEAAQNHIERLLGFKIEANYGGTGQEPVPPALAEAVKQLAAHWYEYREAVSFGSSGQEMPFSVSEIVREYRNWSF